MSANESGCGCRTSDFHENGGDVHNLAFLILPGLPLSFPSWIRNREACAEGPPSSLSAAHWTEQVDNLPRSLRIRDPGEHCRRGGPPCHVFLAEPKKKVQMSDPFLGGPSALVLPLSILSPLSSSHWLPALPFPPPTLDPAAEFRFCLILQACHKVGNRCECRSHRLHRCRGRN